MRLQNFSLSSILKYAIPGGKEKNTNIPCVVEIQNFSSAASLNRAPETL